MKLIDKDTLVAEIRKRLLSVIRDKHYDEWEEGRDSERIAILDIIDTLEVKDVDFKLWHSKNEEPNNFEHCLINYGGERYIDFDLVIYNKSDKSFVTANYPHPTGRKAKFNSIDNGLVIENYLTCYMFFGGTMIIKRDRYLQKLIERRHSSYIKIITGIQLFFEFPVVLPSISACVYQAKASFGIACHA